MKIIGKTTDLLRRKAGETMVEVIVAFALLAIMLVVFAQGLAFAANSEAQANEKRISSDASMLELQQKLASNTAPNSKTPVTDSNFTDLIEHCEYATSGGNTYIVYRPK